MLIHKRSVFARASFAGLVLALVLGAGRQSVTLAAAGDPTEFILRAPADRVEAIAARYGLTIVRQIEGHPDVYLVRAITGAATLAAPSDDAPGPVQTVTSTVLSDADVLNFEVNGSAVISEVQSAPRLNESTVVILDSLLNRTLTPFYGTTVWERYVNQPAAGIIRLGPAHQLATGSGVVVAIIDTGVDPRHPALQGALVPGYDFTRDTAGPASEWADLDESTVVILDQAGVSILDLSAPVSLNESTVVILDTAAASTLDITRLPHAFGHGTMVAGLVHMVAPSAAIMPLKAFKADGTSSLFDIERAIYYAVDHGAKVINMSFSMDTASAEITHAIDYASAHGVICLASAGNSGRSAVVFPAGFRNVIGIGSTSETDARSSFSNYGDHLVKLAAPGEMLTTLYPGGRYATVSGTSFSTALVTGAVGLLAQLEPAVDQRLAGRELDDGAVKRPESELGDGRVDLFATLRPHSTTTAAADTTAPTVTPLSPGDGATVTGLFPVAVSASDDVGVVAVRFTLDGGSLGAEETSAPYELTWDTSSVANGVHVLTAIARDAAGNQGSASVSVTVANDRSAPTVAVVSPTADSMVSGTFAVRVNASDDVGVGSVKVAVDSVSIGALQTAAPYEWSWDSRTVTDGVHVLTATARDAAGNQRSASVSITVANDTTAPTVTVLSPAGGATVTGTITFGVSASDDVGVAGVQLALDGVNLGAEHTAAPYERSWDSRTVPNGVHVLMATARDAAGNQRNASVSVTVANDTTAPTVAVFSPAGGATVTGTIVCSVGASDDVGVVGVQLTLDGVNLGAEHTAAPYEWSWNSATVPNGMHTLTATARDAAGNQRSASVNVTVANDTTAPTVAVISPAAETTVAGTITFSIDASDDVGVVAMQVAVDGVTIGPEQTWAPYEWSWDSATVPDGLHVLTATARDAAGNQGMATSVLSIANGAPQP